MQPARAGVGAAQLELGRLLRLHGRAQPVRGLQLLREDLGNFKLFGGMGLMLLFVVGAVRCCSRSTSRTSSSERRRRRSASGLAALEPLDARPGRRERAAPRPCRLPRRRRHALAARPSCRRASPASRTVARHRMVYQALGEPHAASHPRARHHGAQPRRNERKAMKNRIVPAAALLAAPRWRSCRCRRKDKPGQEAKPPPKAAAKPQPRGQGRRPSPR